MKNKNNIIIVVVIILITVLLAGGIILFLNNKKENNKMLNTETGNNILQNEYDCTLLKTYRVHEIYTSNDYNYLYITFSQFQVEGVYTIKLPKSISGNLEKGKNYEFTFMINKAYVNANPDVIFNNSQVLNVEFTENIGLAQKNEYTCK